MKIIVLSIFGISLFVFAVDLALLARHCDAGVLGYPDRWDLPIQEKIHHVLAPICITILGIDFILTIIHTIIM